jgi:hypothetical protein
VPGVEKAPAEPLGGVLPERQSRQVRRQRTEVQQPAKILYSMNQTRPGRKK